MQSKKTNKIMILGAGEIQVPVIKKSKELGFFTIAVDFDEDAPGFAFTDKNLVISTHNNRKILEATKNYNIDGILTTSDYPVRGVALVSKQMNLRGLSQEAANISTNKHLLREYLKNSNILSPKYKLIDSTEDLEKIDFFPLVMKPIDSSGSRGVKKINSKQELLEFYDESKKYSINGKVLIEEFIEGEEYSIESFTNNGLTKIIAITEKSKVGEKEGYFVESSHIIPAKIEDSIYKAISKEVTKSLEAIGLDDSASHSEVIVSKKGVYIIEIGARLGGDFIASDLVILATGIDMLKNVINLSLGKELDFEIKANKHSGIQFIIPKNYRSAKAFIEKKTENLVRFSIEKYRDVKIKNSLDRLGYIIVVADSRDELDKILIEINYENRQ